MSNQELISFPFRPYLAHYLFALSKKEVIETEEAYYKHLDIQLKSAEGKFLRVLCTTKRLPVIEVPTKGYRLTIRIPKKSTIYPHIIEDSRSKTVWIDDETAELVQEHFDKWFRDHFVAFVSGAIYGSESERGILKRAIMYFMENYHLDQDNPYYNYEQMLKIYERSVTPLKGNIYSPKTKNSPED